MRSTWQQGGYQVPGKSARRENKVCGMKKKKQSELIPTRMNNDMSNKKVVCDRFHGKNDESGFPALFAYVA